MLVRERDHTGIQRNNIPSSAKQKQLRLEFATLFAVVKKKEELSAFPVQCRERTCIVIKDYELYADAAAAVAVQARNAFACLNWVCSSRLGPFLTFPDTRVLIFGDNCEQIDAPSYKQQPLIFLASRQQSLAFAIHENQKPFMLQGCTDHALAVDAPF